jgi:3-oxoacyl-[acyl-carrier protein] reductase
MRDAGCGSRIPLVSERVAIVTGGTRGIGISIARKLGLLGYRLVINHRSNVAVARKAAKDLAPFEPLIVKADVIRRNGARAVIGAALKKWKRIDLLVNNVGDFFETPVSKMELEKWEILWDSNLRTALNCTREVLPSMRKAGRGVVINIGGTASQMSRGNPVYVAYAMAKTALATFTKSLAKSEASKGVRVNMVAPGYIQTYAYDEEDLRTMPPQVPMKRLGRPEELAEAVAWLASDAASYVTGAVLDVGGGLGV